MRTRIHCAAAAALALALCAAAPPAWALDRPAASPKDQRIRWTDYDPADVVQIDTTLGVATQIQLNDDEDYVTHAFGDSAAYDFQQIGKHLLLKPIVEQADTNLLYITTKRNYSFLLKYEKARKSGGVFRVVLRYPELEQAKSAAQEERERVQRDLATADVAINWQAPGWPWVDPAKDAAANEKKLAMRVTTRRAICTEMGVDFDEVLEQLAREEKAISAVLPAPKPKGEGNAPEEEK